MTRSPDVSVIIPVYNGERYVERAIQSALSQIGINVEIIVVNDGSTDATGQLLRELSTDICLIETENRGQAAARNRAITHAQAEIIAFLDADDWWAAEKLQSQLTVFRDEPQLDVVFSDFRNVDVDGEPSGWQGGLVNQLTQRGLTMTRINSAGYAIDGSVLQTLIRYTSFMHPSTVVIRREVVDRLGGFDETMSPAEDLDYWIKLARQCKFGIVDRILVTTEGRPESQGRQTIRMDEQLIRLYGSLKSSSPPLSSELAEFVDDFVVRKHASLAWHYRQSGDSVSARRHYEAALNCGWNLRLLVGWARSYL